MRVQGSGFRIEGSGFRLRRHLLGAFVQEEERESARERERAREGAGAGVRESKGDIEKVSENVRERAAPVWSGCPWRG